jgi:hypothetical protein
MSRGRGIEHAASLHHCDGDDGHLALDGTTMIYDFLEKT